MRKISIVITALLGTASHPVFAQASTQPLDTAPAASESSEGQSTSSGGLEEIIVTAQRRSERLQDVPISISALTSDSMERRGIGQSLELGSAVPGLVVSLSAVSVQPFLRGVGNSGFSPGNDPSVATYVDDVYQSAPMGLIFSMNNIERVEVLKGPQGTLFGRNATGGLINIITRTPTSTPQAKLSVGVDSFKTLSASGYVSGGNDFIAADLAVSYSNQADGWGRNRFQPGDEGVIISQGVQVANPPIRRDVGILKQLGLSSKVVVTPSDNTTITFGARYLESDGDQGLYRRGVPGATLTGTPVNGVAQPFTYDAIGGGFYDIRSDADWYYHIKQFQASVRIEQETPIATLRSISSYLRATSDQLSPSDATPSPTNSGVSGTNLTWRTVTQELQVLTNDSAPDWFKAIGGLFYMRQRAGYDPTTIFTGYKVFPVQDRYGIAINTSIAAFGQFTFKLGENTNITAGARYTWDRLQTEQWFVGRLEAGNTSPLGPTAVAGVVSSVIPLTETNQSAPTFRLSIDHKFSPDILGYVSYNRGYKAGAYNLLGNPAGATTSAPAVDPEKLTAYEVGIKSDLLDRRLRVNLAGFYYSYNNLQVQGAIGIPPVSFLANAASARIYGLDYEVVASPLDNLTISFGGSFLDAKFRDFPNAIISVPRGYLTNVNGTPTVLTNLATAPNNVLIPGPALAPYGNINVILPNAAGNTLPRSPKFTSTLSADWTIPVGDAAVTLSPSWYHNSGLFWEVANRVKEPSYDLFNFQVSIALPGDKVTVRAYGRNITGKKYYSFQYNTTAGDHGQPAAPATFGVSLDWKL